jgi:rRNA-processing protein FCF1
MAQVTGHTVPMKRHNLSIPQTVYDELQEVADQRQTSIIALIRQAIKLLLLVVRAESTPGMEFIIRENGTEQRVVIL